MADYTPPAGDEVDFTFEGGYTAPAGDQVNFLFGLVATITISSVSRTTIYDDSLIPGFDTSRIRWSSDTPGPYLIEMGGTGAETGDTLASGNAIADYGMEILITDELIEAAPSFTGSDSYQFSIYVKSSDNIWNPQS
ncbi:MAG: hypothetical protein DRQ47_04185 [Gammaproteobacteria bacterium]|nr:MAG: hypothetical protein DRQ47_04185 [Gammaproteobacteria bacterium]